MATAYELLEQFYGNIPDDDDKLTLAHFIYNATVAEIQVFYEAAQHLSERVDQYLVQGCSRAELKAANDALRTTH